MDMEREFVMIKPDAVQRGLIGEIISRIEKSGLKIVAMKFLLVSDEQAKAHYAEHEGKPFYNGLVSFITSGPTVAMVVEGYNAISKMRKLAGLTNPQEAAPGTIRSDYGQHIGRNIIHASDKAESAAREIAIYFTEEEIVSWNWIHEQWLYED